MKTPTAYYLVSFLSYGSDNNYGIVMTFQYFIADFEIRTFLLNLSFTSLQTKCLVPVKVLRLHRCSRLRVLNLGIFLGRLFTSVAIQAQMFLSSVWCLCGI